VEDQTVRDLFDMDKPVRSIQPEETRRWMKELTPSPPQLAITIPANLAVLARHETPPFVDEHGGGVRITSLLSFSGFQQQNSHRR
jgi:hypothetical protein